MPFFTTQERTFKTGWKFYLCWHKEIFRSKNQECIRFFDVRTFDISKSHFCFALSMNMQTSSHIRHKNFHFVNKGKIQTIAPRCADFLESFDP
jgi:hypothetical protein